MRYLVITGNPFAMSKDADYQAVGEKATVGTNDKA